MERGRKTPQLSAEREHIARVKKARSASDGLGLPTLLGSDDLIDKQYWKRMAHDLPNFEAALCDWETLHPEIYQAMPWYEEREAFKAAKLKGEVRFPEWWELSGAVRKVGTLVTPSKLPRPQKKLPKRSKRC